MPDVPTSLGAAVSRYAQARVMRYRQLLSTRPEDIAELFVNLRQAQAVPQPDYHFRKHGEDLGVDNVDAYQAAFRRFLGRDDLRVFTYLRPKDNTAMWELVAPDNGTTVMYNESRKAILSFLRPDDAAARMEAAQGWWIELVRGAHSWVFVEHWQWQKTKR